MAVSFQGMTFDEFISPAELTQMAQNVSKQIAEDYAGRKPHFICVLNGALFFFVDVLKALPLDFQCTLSCVQLRSYEGTDTIGKVEEVLPLKVDIRDRDVILVEDIVDSGLTMHFYKQKLMELKPRSLKVAAMFCKPSELKYPDAAPDYVGQEIPKKFILGYGLDIDGLARNLPSIYALRPEPK